MPKMNSLFVDTSGWATYLDRREPLHRQTRAAYQRAVASKRHIVTTNYIVAELIALLDSHNVLPRHEIIAFVEALAATPHVEIIHVDPQTHAEAFALLKIHLDKHWSLVDAASFVLMRRAGTIEALATDKHFAQAGFVRVPQQ